ncbi:hypothetical protein GCM10010112_67440 [Actinoplanes lobatus]|uniref:Non-specific serine/threonine protein kinase n=1 Tax=Actinoplanes lobatus TaxID=113568 RepID=A0A7W7HI50_9ACTN|nr:LuxR C-terminal-related transcriptional regulator [Actinoplanes lobatus]MBB4750927.1 non-specific serine/threonine protein kinase [Actinoplanes lobatus]GGN86195.1 hypothetical protein GCM10010112_67440 [Actinoplanes lobatus]GIE43501.1 hypothetical protein Alo02nite_63990 [Actinoplanes lobatus]
MYGGYEVSRDHLPGVTETIERSSGFIPVGSLLPLVGRTEELATLTGHLLSPDLRILNLTGPGGVGKTRLALAATELAADEHPVDVVIADLAGVTDGRAALAALADRVFPPGAGDGHELLLVLDGCERAAGLAAELHHLLTAAPRLRVLATSREALGVYGERLFRVDPLPTPRQGARADPLEIEEYASVALFVQRARTVDPAFALTADNAAVVARLCARLDGLPLAIELCAGRLRLFSLATMLTRVRAGNGVLTGGHVAAHPRQRSLTATIEWSLDALEPPLREALDRLSLCLDGFDLRTVEELCELTPDAAEHTVEALADRSLITAAEHTGDEPRFRMLRTMAAHCRDRLTRIPGQLEAARDRHARYFAALAARTGPALDGSTQATALSRLRTVHDDLLAALTHLSAGGLHREVAAHCLNLHRYFLIDTRAAEGLRLLDAAAEQCAETDPSLAARVRDAAGQLAMAIGDPGAAASRHERAVDVLADAVGDPADALQARARGRTARLLAGSGTGRDPAARILPALDESRPAAAAAVRLSLADVLIRNGDLVAAAEHAETALAAYRRLDDTYGEALALRQAAVIADAEGAVERADQLHRRSLRMLYEVGAEGELGRGMTHAALLLLSCVAGQETRVARVLGTADAVRERAGITLLPHESAALRTAADDVRTRLGALAFETAWRTGGRSSAAAATLDLLSAPGAEPVEILDGSRARTLTARQFQVAMLVGQGMTNRQVAKRLELSEWTVINHVRQIMRKLDLPSRVHVAQWISQQRGAESTGYAEAAGRADAG